MRSIQPPPQVSDINVLGFVGFVSLNRRKNDLVPYIRIFRGKAHLYVGRIALNVYRSLTSEWGNIEFMFLLKIGLQTLYGSKSVYC